MEIRDDLRYTEEHEWVRLDGQSIVVGITDYAQEQLGEIVYVELPEESTALSVGDTFGVVESTKSVSDLFSPIDGEVTRVNEDLLDAPEYVNTDPYGDGWMIRVQPEGDSDEIFESLLSPDEYRKLVGAE
jgi:glycine cleavage system H protein